MAVTENARMAAQTIANACGAIPQIATYADEAGTRSVDIARFVDRPTAGVTTAGTVSLSDHDLGLEDGLRIEIVALFPSSAEAFPLALAGSAIAAIDLGWAIRRGAVHPDILAPYGLSRTMEHLLFVAPTLWEGALDPVVSGEMTVGWLLAIPISEDERAYAEAHGAPALEQLLADHRIEIADLDRPSVAPRSS